MNKEENDVYKSDFDRLKKFANILDVDIIYSNNVETSEYICSNDYRAIVVVPAAFISEWDDCRYQDIAWPILHELGHFIAVSGKRRNLNNYGTPTYSGKSLIKRNSLKWKIDEAKAQAVEKHIVNGLKLQARYAWPMLDEYPEGLVWYSRRGHKKAMNFIQKFESKKR